MATIDPSIRENYSFGLLQAYWSAQPRAVRIFDVRLNVIWDNTPDRREAYPAYRDENRKILDMPPDGAERVVWPVGQVLRGHSRAQRFYRAPHEFDGANFFHVRAWPMRDPQDNSLLIVEEMEPVPTDEGCQGAVKMLDREVENLVGKVIQYLETGPNGNILRLRLTNDNLKPCQDVKDCTRPECPAFNGESLRCWELPNTLCPDHADEKDPISKFRYCSKCEVFLLACPDPLTRVAENFNRLISLLQLKYQENLEAQRQVQQADKLAVLGELLASVAHEIKNPLGIITGRLELINMEIGSLSEEELTEDFEVVHTQASRLRHIIDHLLNMARPQPLNRTEVRIPDIIRETLGMVRKALKREEIETEVRILQDLPTVQGDSIQLQQVLLNLVLNARDAMEQGGTLTITAYEQNDGVLLSVSDTGCGMSDEDVSRIFSPFFSTKFHKGGTGLGLAVCQRLVRAHDGRIEVRSKPGKGSEVSVWLPVRKTRK
ncbi:hypothetical protein KQI84_02645 [bacterium]|nr:hypothetical protein [bacterium]